MPNSFIDEGFSSEMPHGIVFVARNNMPVDMMFDICKMSIVESVGVESLLDRPNQFRKNDRPKFLMFLAGEGERIVSSFVFQKDNAAPKIGLVVPMEDYLPSRPIEKDVWTISKGDCFIHTLFLIQVQHMLVPCDIRVN